MKDGKRYSAGPVQYVIWDDDAVPLGVCADIQAGFR